MAATATVRKAATRPTMTAASMRSAGRRSSLRPRSSRLRRVMWVDLRCGEADAHQGVGGDGRCGSGEQSPEGMSAVPGQSHLLGDLAEAGLDPVAPLGDDLQQEGGRAGALVLGGRDKDC